MSKKKQQKDKPIKVAMPEFAQAMREIGRSSRTSPHDNRPNRLRTREDVKRNAIKNSEW